MKYDCIIIGAGPAGVGAAIYLQRANRKICIIEKNVPGGKLNTISTIENYLGFESINGPDLALNLYKQINKLNIELKNEEALSIEALPDKKIVKTNKGQYESDFVILATGRKTKKLHLKDEETLEGRGISYCAVCDGPLYKNKEVVVIGGGTSAVQEAIHLADFCKKVTIINKNNLFKVEHTILEKAEVKENINILYNAKIKEYKKEKDQLNHVVVTIDNKEKNIKADGCFVFIGSEEQTKLLANLVTDEKGYILCDDRMQTSVDKIYACGDNIKKDVYQIVTAAAEGAVAALDILKRR